MEDAHTKRRLVNRPGLLRLGSAPVLRVAAVLKTLRSYLVPFVCCALPTPSAQGGVASAGQLGATDVADSAAAGGLEGSAEASPSHPGIGQAGAEVAVSVRRLSIAIVWP